MPKKTIGTTGLIKFDAAIRALAAASSVDEVKAIRDKAEAARKYAQQAGISLDGQNIIAEIKLRAERKAGQILREMKRHKSSDGRPPKGGHRDPHIPTLGDLGISKNQSKRWQLEATIPDQDFEEHVEQTTKSGGELTSVGVRKLAKKLRLKQENHKPAVVYEDVVYSLDDLIKEGKKFKTIYADPPWSYSNQATRSATSNHYDGMSVDEICEMPIPELTEDEAHLHLWTTNGFLFEAKRVMEAWGFEYKSILLWCKPQMGIGNYWRVCHEFLLFGNRGKLPMMDARRKLRSWHEIDRTTHSAKPHHFRALVEQVSPPARIELFAREAHREWVAYGNEILGAEMWNK